MTLKRKASYTTIISPRSSSSSYNASVAPVPFMTGDAIIIDETPRHMHSRTRKRFKNDRPDEQTVYDKTMQFLYSAQKQLKHRDSSAPFTSIDTDEDETMNTLPVTLDPAQQSLRKFFQPAQTSTPMLSSSSTNNTSTQKGTAFTARVGSHFGSAATVTTAPSMDVDMEMCMDIDTPSDASSSPSDVQKRWVGGIGWM